MVKLKYLFNNNAKLLKIYELLIYLKIHTII